MQLRTVCDIRLHVPITTGSFDAKISTDIQQTLNLFCNNVSIIEDKIFATDFLRFYRAMLAQSAVKRLLSSVRLSVCLSVCP